jgi:L-fucose isomerase-like protein
VKVKPRVGFAVIRHPLEEGGAKAPAVFAEGAKVLRRAGMEVVEAPRLIEDEISAVAVGRHFYDERTPLIVLAAATWSADPLVLDLLEECSVPIVTWALPGMNTGSMCGCQQFGYVLKELGRPYRFVFGDLNDLEAVRRVCNYASAVTLAAELRKTRMGLIGYRIGGMTEVTFDELELKAVFGPRVVHYGFETVLNAMAGIPETTALTTWQQQFSQIRNVSIGRSEMVDSMQAYMTLKQFADRDCLSGIAIECYPRFMGRFCLAASLLADEGVVIGCEGDMNSTLAMLILSRLTGGPVHNTDSLGAEVHEGSIVYSHCGSGSLKLAPSLDDVQIGHVRLMNEGACVLFPGRPGPVTLVNLVGRRGTYRMGVGFGHATTTGMVFAGNPTKVMLDGGVQRHLDIVAREGLGHHWMIGYGDVRDPLAEFCAVVGVPYVPCT